MAPDNRRADPPSPEDPPTRSAFSDATNATTVQRSNDRRHASRQLPIVLSATVYTPAYGMVFALIVTDDACPACGFWHSHRLKWPAPVLVTRKARCGQRYELALHPPRAIKRKRVA